MHDKKTNFGFKQVWSKDKYKLVKEVFTKVAPVYDVMNDLMSLGVHRVWKKEFVNLILDNKPLNMLDVGGGTGDISFKLKEQISDLDIFILDINKEMLLNGINKSLDKGFTDKITWILGDAENLPFKDESFNSYCTAFCFRNLTNIDKALNEAYRVLEKGGRFYCLEFSKVENSVLDKIYKLWSFKVIPKIGKLVANNRKAYQYLVESIDKFYSPSEYSKLIEQAGFNNVSYRSLSFGIASIHTGVKV